jgi:hypothetical protein
VGSCTRQALPFAGMLKPPLRTVSAVLATRTATPAAAAGVPYFSSSSSSSSSRHLVPPLTPHTTLQLVHPAVDQANAPLLSTLCCCWRDKSPSLPPSARFLKRLAEAPASPSTCTNLKPSPAADSATQRY